MNATDHLKRVLAASQEHSGRIPEDVYNEALAFLDTLSRNEEEDKVRLEFMGLGGKWPAAEGPLLSDADTEIEAPKRRKGK